VSKFGEKGNQPGQFRAPEGDHDRILITDRANARVQSWSLSEQSFLSCVGHRGSGDLEFHWYHGIAIDKHHRRIVIVYTGNARLVFLSSIDLSFLFSIGKKGTQPGEFSFPTGALRSIMTDIESSSPIPSTIECKCCH